MQVLKHNFGVRDVSFIKLELWARNYNASLKLSKT